MSPGQAGKQGSFAWPCVRPKHRRVRSANAAGRASGCLTRRSLSPGAVVVRNGKLAGGQSLAHEFVPAGKKAECFTLAGIERIATIRPRRLRKKGQAVEAVLFEKWIVRAPSAVKMTRRQQAKRSSKNHRVNQHNHAPRAPLRSKAPHGRIPPALSTASRRECDRQQRQLG